MYNTVAVDDAAGEVSVCDVGVITNERSVSSKLKYEYEFIFTVVLFHRRTKL